jgi:hypothetical protein
MSMRAPSSSVHHLARALGAQAHALRSLAVHAQGDRLHVEHDVGHVLAHTRDRGELVQDSVDLDAGHRRALERGQQDPAKRVAERQAESALQRLGHDLRQALGIVARLNVELVRLDQFRPVLLQHGCALMTWKLCRDRSGKSRSRYPISPRPARPTATL